MKFNDIHTIYFLGIGGIGMSALARYFHRHGAKVYGYDRTPTALTRALEQEGMHVHYTDDPGMIPANLDLAVWTPALPSTHQELTAIRNSETPLFKRAEVLGIISKSKRCAAISGTHGKTSTSCLTAHLFHAGGIDASAFLGGIALNFNSNFIEGNSDWVVAEADEYDRSFMHLHPEITVLNSMDADHLDIYETHEAMQDTYRAFLQQIKPGGTLLYKTGLPIDALANRMKGEGYAVARFGIEQGDLQAQNMRIEQGMQCFRLAAGDQWPGPVFDPVDVSIRFPGAHNVHNAVAAAGIALRAGIPAEKVAEGLGSYAGVRRRFEYVFQSPDYTYIDDYAHHPEELKACISAVRSLFPDRKITGVFQPHLFSRTRDFADGFAEALDGLDQCILLPIYPAREEPIPGVDSAMLMARMNLKDKRILEINEVVPFLEKQDVEVLLTMGAGSIDTLVEPIKNHLLTRKTAQKL
jgi:UDP-N-acetylmuramate--alanine ligase